MSLFKELLKESKIQLVTSCALSLISAGCNVILIYFISKAIAGDLALVWTNGVMFLTMVILTFAFGVTTQRILAKLGIEVVASLRMSLSGRILSTDFNKLEKLGKANLYTSLVDDINSIYNTFITIPLLTFNLFLVIGGMAYMGYLSYAYLGIFTALLVLAVVVIRSLTSRLDDALLKHRNNQVGLHHDFHTLTDGTRELCISQSKRHHFYHRIISSSVDLTKQSSLESGYHTATLNNAMSLIVFCIFGTLIFLVQPWLPVSEEVLSGFLVTLMFIRNPIGITIDSIPVIVRAQHAFDKIAQLELSSQSNWIDNHSAPTRIDDKALLTLSLNQIQYQYPEVNGEQGFEVGPLSLDIKCGELIFIVGGNGSGKSTFGKLLTCLYSPQNGHLSLNGKPIDKSNKQWFQNHLSVIFSDFYLFDFIVNNEGETRYDEEVDRWLEVLKLDDKVSIKDGRISSIKLSHGQRKRLALLAAYLEEKPILLFDEWAADQDPAFRDFFYNDLLTMLKKQGKVLFVISHDESYFHLADRLYQMNNGRLVLA